MTHLLQERCTFTCVLRMHSVLQTEVRISRKIINQSSRNYVESCQSRPRRFHRTSTLRIPSGTQNPAAVGSGASGERPKNTSNNFEVKPKLRKPHQNLPTIDHEFAANPTGPPPEGEDQSQVASFYGSSSKRRLRSRIVREAEPGHYAPEWFVNNNVILHDQSRLSSDRPSGIQLVKSDWKTGDLISHEPAGSNDDVPVKLSESSAAENASIEAIDTSHSDFTSREETVSGKNSRIPDDSFLGGVKTPNASKRYFVVHEQYQEVERTARGLLQLKEAPQLSPGVSSSKADLLLHYAGRDGELLLEELTQTLTQDLKTHYIALDAQDISELISGSNERSEIIADGCMLSYDVYANVYEEGSDSLGVETFAYEEDDDGENADHFENSNPASSMGMPVIIGKPITIDLKSMFGPRSSSRRSDQSIFPKNVFSEMFRDASSKSKNQPNVFSGVVESILNAINQKKTTQGSLEVSTMNSKRVFKEPIIIQIQGFKAIHDTPVGKQFLSELSEQVERRRRNDGIPIIVIGTDSAVEDQSTYSVPRIEEIQRAREDEITRSIVLTPVLPDTRSKIVLLQDRKQRVATINMRHLWTMTSSMQPSIFPQLDSGFWRENFLEKLGRDDHAVLESQIWNLSYVHRLATWLGGSRLNFQDPASPPQSTLKRHSNKETEEEHSANADTLLESSIRLAAEGLKHSDRSKMRWAERQNSSRVELAERLKPPEDARLSRIKAAASKYEKRLLSGVIEPEKISTSFNDVHVPTETVDALQTLTTLSLIRPEAFRYGILASDKIPGLLLYGPPGTGKTLLAKAVAKESGATVLEVSGADINDMYVGEGEKNVKALFSLAKKLSPCVVFLDEADAMFSARSNSGRRVSHRELLNQFLREWDGMSNASGSAFLMVATNRPMDLDDAVLRRLPRRLLVDLPAEADRLEILRIHLRNEQLAEDINLTEIASKTPFYSGSDLKNVAVAAALNAVREENEMAKQHTGDEPFKHRDRRILTKQHFEKALDEISASISEDMPSLREIKKFDEQYGDKKGRKRKAPKWGFRTASEADPVLDTVKVRS